MSVVSNRAASPQPQIIRTPNLADAARIGALARSLPELDRYSPYLYLLLCDHFAETCVIAERASELVGFVTGYRKPSDAHTLFVWQVGTRGDARGQGIAGALLDALFARPELATVRYLETTVAPDNDASRRLFSRFANMRGAPIEERPGYGPELFSTPHQAEPLLCIGPIPRK